MNKTIMTGRLTRDAEIRYGGADNSKAVARFSIAVRRKFRKDDEPDADFFNCVAFGAQAAFMEKYGHKGVKFEVVGRFQNDNYTTKDGEQRKDYTLVAEEIEFAESKAGDAPASAPAASAPAASTAGESFVEEELPFN